MKTATPNPQSATHNPQSAYAVSRPLIITGLIAAVALSALDATIVSTAMPTIVGQLRGLPLYPLVIAAYLLTSTTTMPLYGKLSDMYGRKPIFMAGAGIFIVGSFLCGLAWDMPTLIAFRGVQGLGAGAVIPVSLTLVGDLFEIEERAKLSGIFSSVWGVSSVIGPVIGGAIVQLWDWRWVFFVNVPVGVIAALLIFTNLREPRVHTRQRVDIAGAATLIVGMSLLLIALSNFGQWALDFALVTGAIALLIAFGYIERRAASPILSIALLKRPTIMVSCLVGIFSGAVLVGISAYVPLLVQGSWGGTPIEAGLIIAPLSIGWPIASATGGRLIRNFGYRAISLVGVFTLVVGTLLLLGSRVRDEGIGIIPPYSLTLLPGHTTGTIIIILATFICGLGFGFSMTAMLIAVQNSVAWAERGIATASLQFFRSMGNAVGATMLGAVLTTTLTSLLTTPHMQALLTQLPPAAHSGNDNHSTLGPVNALFDLNIRDTLTQPLRTALADALSSGLGWVYVAIMLMAVIGALLAIKFPKEMG